MKNRVVSIVQIVLLFFVPLALLFAALGLRLDLIFILIPFAILSAGISYGLYRIFRKPFVLHLSTILLIGVAIVLILVALIFPVSGNGWGDLVLVAMAFVLFVVGCWTRSVILLAQIIHQARLAKKVSI
jgi:hypothetical protein